MWLADKWKDFEVVDCSCGEKLERWGKYFLVRPDPQVIWKTEKKPANGKIPTLFTGVLRAAEEVGR